MPLPCCAGDAAPNAAAAAPAAPHGDGGYHVVHHWPLLPDDMTLGAVAGVGVDAHDDVLIFRRAGRLWQDPFDTRPIVPPAVLRFDGRSGALRDAWGANYFALPHGLSVDHQDNVWLTDVALHQVYKFSHDGRLLLTLGERGVPGNDRAHFNSPTDVAVAPDGSFYVSDGYFNARVMKFAADGRFLFEWGTSGKGPGQFDLPHAIVLDAGGRVHVADRSNARVQIFDGDGGYIGEWKGPMFGRPYDVAIATDGTVFIADGGDQPAEPPDRSGVAVARPDGTVTARFGRFGYYDGEFAMAHAIATATDGSVYVGDITGMRVQKFICPQRTSARRATA